MSSSPLVLITGATGHIGFNSLILLLKAGYHVRAAVRSEAKSQKILDNPIFKAGNFPEALLTFVIVPDLAVPNAYDEAVAGVDYVIHIASPLPAGGEHTQEQYEEFFIKPAVAGTVGMLESAAKSSSIKRVVITSSVVAMITFKDIISGYPEAITAESRAPFNAGPYHVEFEAYVASKTKALEETEKWLTANKPNFSVVHIHPSLVLGRDDLVETADEALKGTNGFVLRIVNGVKAPFPFPATTVHADDVAKIHVDAIKPEIPAGSYIAHSNPAGSVDGSNWDDVTSIVARKFPEAIEKGLFPNDGAQPNVAGPIDASKTEKVFGIKFKSFEEQVESVVGHYVELLSKA